MEKRIILKLRSLIETNGYQSNIDMCEDIIIGSIGRFVKEDEFYSLPTNEILELLGKSNIKNKKLLPTIASKMNASKGKDAIQLLNVLNPDGLAFESCISVISEIKSSPFLKKIGYLHAEDKGLVDIDYKGMIDDLRKKLNEKESEYEILKNAIFPPVSEEPPQFISSLTEAAEKEDLESIQYNIEHFHVDVNTKNLYGKTPINIAACNGNLEIVKYLFGICHANIEIKDNNGNTPINNASGKGNLSIVKYLHKVCKADIKTKNNNGLTPQENAKSNSKNNIVEYFNKTEVPLPDLPHIDHP